MKINVSSLNWYLTIRSTPKKDLTLWNCPSATGMRSLSTASWFVIRMRNVKALWLMGHHCVIYCFIKRLSWDKRWMFENETARRRAYWFAKEMKGFSDFGRVRLLTLFLNHLIWKPPVCHIDILSTIGHRSRRSQCFTFYLFVSLKNLRTIDNIHSQTFKFN